jgi:hypothetical protein
MAFTKCAEAFTAGPRMAQRLLEPHHRVGQQPMYALNCLLCLTLIRMPVPGRLQLNDTGVINQITVVALDGDVDYAVADA